MTHVIGRKYLIFTCILEIHILSGSVYGNCFDDLK